VIALSLAGSTLRPARLVKKLKMTSAMAVTAPTSCTYRHWKGLSNGIDRHWATIIPRPIEIWCSVPNTRLKRFGAISDRWRGTVTSTRPEAIPINNLASVLDRIERLTFLPPGVQAHLPARQTRCQWQTPAPTPVKDLFSRDGVSPSRSRGYQEVPQESAVSLQPRTLIPGASVGSTFKAYR